MKPRKTVSRSLVLKTKATAYLNMGYADKGSIKANAEAFDQMDKGKLRGLSRLSQNCYAVELIATFHCLGFDFKQADEPSRFFLSKQYEVCACQFYIDTMTARIVDGMGRECHPLLIQTKSIGYNDFPKLIRDHEQMAADCQIALKYYEEI